MPSLQDRVYQDT